MADFAQSVTPINFQSNDNSGAILARGITQAAATEASAMQAIPGMVETGMNIWKNVELNNLTKDMNALNTEYESRRTANSVVTDHNDQLNKLTDAFQQGAMSKDEYDTRLRAITRKYSNRAPGFTSDFVQQTRKIMEFSNINAMMNFDEKALELAYKQHENMVSQIYQRAKEAGLPIKSELLNQDAYLFDLQDKTNAILEKNMLVQESDNRIKSNQKLAEQEKEDLLIPRREYGGKSTMAFAMEGRQSRTVNNLLSIFKGDTGVTDIVKRKQEAEFLVANELADIEQYLAVYTNDTRVKGLLDSHKTVLTTLKDSLVNAATDEAAVKYLENKVSLYKNQDFLNFSSQVGMGPQSIDLLTKVISNPLLLEGILNQEGGKQYLNDISNALINATGKLLPPKAMPTFIDMFKGTLGSNWNDPEVAKARNNAAGVLLEGAGKLSPQERYKTFDGFIAALADPSSNKDAIKSLDAKGKADTLDIINGFSKQTFTSMVTELNRVSKGQPFKVEVYPDGTMYLDGNIPNDIKAKFTSRLNNSLVAMANVMGSDIKTVGRDYFYPMITGESPAKQQQAAPETTPPKQSASPTKQESQLEIKGAPVTEADKAYFAAQDAAAKQRSEFYSQVGGVVSDIANKINEFIPPVDNPAGQAARALYSSGLVLVDGVVTKITDLKDSMAWDWDYYRKTGQLKHKSETKGMKEGK